MSQAIKEHAEMLGIPFLVHFTRAVNLPSILAQGIIPRADVYAVNAAAEVNDDNRYDNRRDGTCLSIAHPNASMFYKYRQLPENAGVDWVVLALSKSIFWEKPCAFCKYNAATAGMRDTPLRMLNGQEALAGMYEDVEGDQSRASQKLKAYDPTDKQAEVMVFDVIEPTYILGAAFQSKVVMDRYRELFGTRKLVLHPGDKGLFASRSFVRIYG